ncbi:MAG TPA: FAD-binding oxidoreductase [Acidimicrobiales bacterium]|nr:FAD-binding oxidoreductase [Acidimicrobiales bacterium]
MPEPPSAETGAGADSGTAESEERTLSGWGRTSPSNARVIAPEDPGDIFGSVLRAAGTRDGSPGRGVIARGLGRSYGDAAQCAGGVVVDTRNLGRIGPIDPDSGVVEVEAGVSLDTLLRVGLQSGWFIPVSPGTRQVTIGGAIAADIHGKNHHTDGSFCRHVTSVTLATPTGVHEVGPDTEPDLFWATAGGMGLTGVVTRALVTMRKVETSWMRVDTERHDNIDSLMAGLERVDRLNRYSVAWVDCAAVGSRLGRGILDAGDHAGASDLPAKRRGDPLSPPRRRGLKMPNLVPPGIVKPLTVSAFNEAWFRKSASRTGQLRRLGGFFHPLDAVSNWNLLFGRRGFVQYQFVVGDAHQGVVPQAIDILQKAGAPCTLSVLKRFGPGDPGPLSFPIPGWTFALDLPVGPPGLRPALRRLDDIVAGVGGRVYLAKDARLEPHTFAAMYPRLGEFNSVRRRVDPDGVLQSDLARRLGICEDSPA